MSSLQVSMAHSPWGGACSCLSQLRVAADPNACINVYWLSPVGLKQYLNEEWGGPSP